MLWSLETDVFLINLTRPSNLEILTKRNILSAIASIFDPLGLIAPVTAIAKIFLQDLWKQQYSWDDSISSELKKFWDKLVCELKKVENISVARHM